MNLATLARRAIPAILASLIPLGAASAADTLPDTARINGLQMPAWIERDRRLVPARPGMRLRPGDVLHSGSGGRFQVDMPEGSVVKMGEQARLTMPRMVTRQDQGGGFFEGAIDVLRGAFRFTTRAIGADRRRDIRVRVGTVTAGIRGTDIWGKSDDSGDFLMLIEGEIEVETPDRAPMVMSQPLQAVRVPPVGAMQEMTMSLPEVQVMAAETEMRPDAAMLMMDGEWKLVLMSVLDASIADRLVATLAEAGYVTETLQVEVRGRTFTRVQIPLLASADHARMLAEEVAGALRHHGAVGHALSAAFRPLRS